MRNARTDDKTPKGRIPPTHASSGRGASARGRRSSNDNKTGGPSVRLSSCILLSLLCCVGYSVSSHWKEIVLLAEAFPGETLRVSSLLGRETRRVESSQWQVTAGLDRLWLFTSGGRRKEQVKRAAHKAHKNSTFKKKKGRTKSKWTGKKEK